MGILGQRECKEDMLKSYKRIFRHEQPPLILSSLPTNYLPTASLVLNHDAQALWSES